MSTIGISGPFLGSQVYLGPDDYDRVREYLHGIAALGCAPLLVLPGTKMPADMRTVRRRSAADKAAQEQARAAGKPRWDKAKSPAGVYPHRRAPAET